MRKLQDLDPPIRGPDEEEVSNMAREHIRKKIGMFALHTNFDANIIELGSVHVLEVQVPQIIDYLIA